METDGNPPLYSGGSFLCGNTLRRGARELLTAEFGAQDGAARTATGAAGRGAARTAAQGRAGMKKGRRRERHYRRPAGLFCEQRALPTEAPSVITGAGGRGAQARALRLAFPGRGFQGIRRAVFRKRAALPTEAPSVITGAGGGAHRRAPCGWRFRDGTFSAYAGPFSVKERRFRWKRRSVSAGRAGGMEAGIYRAEILLRTVHRPHSASAAAAKPTAANTTGSPVSGFVRR